MRAYASAASTPASAKNGASISAGTEREKRSEHADVAARPYARPTRNRWRKKSLLRTNRAAAADFQEAPCQVQNSAAVPNGTSHAAPSFGNAAASASAAHAAMPASRTRIEESMTRRLIFGFVVVLVTAFIVAACGRQVTPNPPGLGAGGALPGYMSVKFDVGGAVQLFQLPIHDRVQYQRQRLDARHSSVPEQLGGVFVGLEVAWAAALRFAARFSS